MLIDRGSFLSRGSARADPSLVTDHLNIHCRPLTAESRPLNNYAHFWTGN